MARDQIIRAMRVSLHIGEVMLQSSVAVAEVEHAMRRVTGALGLSQCEVSITLDTITMCAWDDDEPITLFRVVSLCEPALDRLVAAYALSRRISAGELSANEAHEAANAIAQSPLAYPRGVMIGAAALSAGAWTVFAGAGWGGALAGMLAPTLVARVTRLWNGAGLTGAFATTALAAAVIVAVPHALSVLGVPMNVDAAVAGGLYPLLPGGALVAAVTDGILGAPLSSLAKTLQAVLQALALALGALAALACVVALGFSAPSVAVEVSEPLRVLAAGVAICGLALARGVNPSMTALASLVAMLAWIVPSLTAISSWDRLAAVFAAALVIGFMGQSLARLLRTAPSVFTTSAVYVLVPGMTIYGAMLHFARDEVADGIALVGSALRVALAIATGIALGVMAARTLRFRE